MLIAQSCLTLGNPMDCGPPGSSVHEILQARILEWVTISFSRGSFWPRDQTQVSYIAGRLLTALDIREAYKEENKKWPVILQVWVFLISWNIFFCYLFPAFL